MRLFRRSRQKEAIQLLERARWLITPEEFWVKHRFRDYRYEDQRDGRPDQQYAYCAIGALDEAVLELNAHPKARTIATNRLAMAVNVETIPAWNDDNGTTHADVLEAFDAAIEGRFARTPTHA